MKKKWLLGLWLLLLLLVCWHFLDRSGIFFNETSSSSLGENNLKTGALSQGQILTQYFTPQYDKLESIRVMVCLQNGAVTEGEITLSVYATDGTWQGGKSLGISDISDWVYTEFVLGLSLEAGAEYYFTLSYSGGSIAPCLYYRRQFTAGPVENLLLLYDGEEISYGSLVSAYTYRYPFSASQKLVYLGFLLVLGAVCLSLGEALGKKLQRSSV